MSYFTANGIGFDSHSFDESRKLILGGVIIPNHKGLKAHSDGDALCHAVIDSILGACGLPDIGKLYPDTDRKWKGVSSIKLLSQIANIVQEKACKLVYVDTIVICEKPKISEYSEQMKDKMSSALSIPVERLSIKGKTNEGMGFIGRGEGIACLSIATVERKLND